MDLDHYADGQLIGSWSHTYQTRVDAPASKIVIGQDIGGTGYSQIEVGAYLIYDRALSDLERQQVESYLDDKYFQSVPGTPVAVNDLASTTPGGTAVIDVVANDTDSDGTIDPMTVSIVSSPSNAASFTVNPTTGVVTYVNDGSGLPDSFTYTVDDNLGNTSNVAMVTIGADPVANDDSAPVELGGTAFVDVVSNDTDAGASIDPATVTIVSPPSNALSITVHPTTGVITYVNDGVTLPDTFTYTVDDFDGNTSNVATVTITESSSGVLPVTSGLVLHLESDVDVTLGSGSTVTGWLDASGFDYDLSAAGDPQLVASATPGGEPAIVFDGTGDKLERVGNSALLTLPRNSEDRTVFAVVNHVDTQGVNSGPVYGKSSSNRAFGLVADASDSGQLAVEGFGAANNLGSTTSGEGAGWLVHSAVLEVGMDLDHYADGQLIGSWSHTYQTRVDAPASKIVIGQDIGGTGYSQIEVGAYLIYDRALSDLERQQVEAYLDDKYISGSGAIPPQAVDDDATVAVGGTVVIDVVANDTDSDGTVDPTTVTIVGAASHATSLTVNPTTGDITYVHDGTTLPDSFTYTVDDNEGNTSNEATVTMSEMSTVPVTSGLRILLESDVDVTLGAGTTVTGWVDGSGFDYDLIGFGDPQLVVGAAPSGLPAIVFDGDGDKLERMGNTELLGLPANSEERTVFAVLNHVDSQGVNSGITYGKANPNKAFGLVANASNAGKLAVDGFAAANIFGTNVTGEGAGWLVHSTVLSVGDNLEQYVDGQLASSWTHTHATRVDAPASKIVIGEEIAQTGFSQIEVAAYLVYDRALSPAERTSVEAFLSTKYFGIAFIANSDVAETTIGGTVDIDILANDVGILDPMTVAIVTPASYANSFSVHPTTGVVSYVHDGTTLPDTFTYTVENTSGTVSNVATVSVVNGIPVANDDLAVVALGGTVVVDVLDNDTDYGTLQPSTVTIIMPPSNATSITVNPANGEVTYVNDGVALPDSFTYTVEDNEGNVTPAATVNISMASDPLSLVGFTDESVVNQDLNQPIAVDFLSDGRMLILEKGGKIWISDANTGAKEQYLQLLNIDSAGEKGLLEIAVAPDFDPDAPGDDYFYVYYTPASPDRARVARFSHQENDGGLTSTADLGSEYVVWQDTDGYISCCHFGAGLNFGPDGKIWLTTSDKFTSPNPGEGGTNENYSQDLTLGGGKVIRVNVDGTVPDGTDSWPANPFIDPVDDDPGIPGNQDYHDFIWAYGLRNAFRSSWDLTSEQLFIAEVGGNIQEFSTEDLHIATLGLPGVSYGWPYFEGLVPYNPIDPFTYAPPHSFDPLDYEEPIYARPHDGVGSSIIGGEVYRATQFPVGVG